TADWNQMTGDDRTRHCGACQKNVYNLSGMTRAEAEALLLEHNGELCVRYYQRHDGTILLADCTVGVQRKRDRRRTSARAAALGAGGPAAAGAMARHARAPEPPCARPRDAMPHADAVMGELPPPPAPDVLTQEQRELEMLFPPPDGHANPARFDLEHAEPVMG